MNSTMTQQEKDSIREALRVYAAKYSSKKRLRQV